MCSQEDFMERQVPLIRIGELGLAQYTSEHPLVVGSQDWFAWLENATIFALKVNSAQVTVRKERRMNGLYWYASHRNYGQIRRLYLGKNEDLTAEKLHHVIQIIQQDDSTVQMGNTDKQTRSDAHTYPILSTKLEIPTPHTNTILRPALLDRLNRVYDFPLTLLSAPIGYGKTNAITQWATQSHDSIAWVSLDHEDNDPHRFWSHILIALDKIVPNKLRKMVMDIQHKTVRFGQEKLTTFINILDDASHSIILVLVLDNYHVLADSNMDIHLAIRYIIEHIPTNVHMIIATRKDPSLPLARLRARQQINELHADDLQLTLSEAAQYLVERIGTNIPEHVITLLHSQVEGWIAGLNIAATSLQGKTIDTDTLAEFSNCSRYMHDFLVEEVLNQIHPSILEFLARISICERFTASLCSALMGVNISQKLLEELERENLFVVPLDKTHTWYRFHHSFAEVLRLRCEQQSKVPLRELYYRASQWCLENDLVDEALRYALLSNNNKHTANILEPLVERKFAREGCTAVLAWLKQLPDEVINTCTTLRVFCASIAFHTSNLLDFERLTLEIEQLVDINQTLSTYAQNHLLLAQINALRGITAAAYGEHRQCIALCQQAQKHVLLSGINNEQTQHILLDIGAAYMANGDYYVAAEVFEEIWIYCESHNYPSLFILSSIYLSFIRIEQIRLSESHEICQRVLTHPQAMQLTDELHGIYTCLGLIAFSRNQLGEAAMYLEKSVGSSQDIITTRAGYLALAIVYQKTGNNEKVSQLLLQERLDYEKLPKVWHQLAELHQIIVWMLQGKLDIAKNWVLTSHYMDHGQPQLTTNSHYLLYIQDRQTLAYLLAILGHAKEADTILAALLAEAELTGNTGCFIYTAVLSAYSAEKQERTADSLSILRHALELAQPEQYVAPFIMVDLMPLLEKMHDDYTKENNIPLASFIKTILSNATLQIDQTDNERLQMPNDFQTNPPVQLSDREIQVLNLLANGASNKDLSKQLLIELGTVKRHLSNIYTKLGVQSRTQAIAHAITMNLIEPPRSNLTFPVDENAKKR
jgi:LuxR family transcriptional regulator, maltose regulon positive regulatory protein